MFAFLRVTRLGGKTMIPYLARLFDVTVNNVAIRSDWKKAIAVPINKAGDRWQVSNYRPVSLTSVVCKQMEYVISLYLKKIWDEKDLFAGQHGFRPGYSCEVKKSRFIKTLQTQRITEVG
jgi:hypothetical protein